MGWGKENRSETIDLIFLCDKTIFCTNIVAPYCPLVGRCHNFPVVGAGNCSDWVLAASQWQPAKSTAEKRITWEGVGPISPDDCRTLLQ